jgi:glyoxylase-like metal-dependent hydrolase (beta-lactamase superfamily II)
MHTTGIVKHLQSNAPNNMVPARVTFTDETSIFLGGKEVRAKYFERAHTNGDAFVYFPAHRLVHSGDSFASLRWRSSTSVGILRWR